MGHTAWEKSSESYTVPDRKVLLRLDSQVEIVANLELSLSSWHEEMESADSWADHVFAAVGTDILLVATENTKS